MDDREAPEGTSYALCTGPLCKRLVLWAMTLGGSRIPLDPDKADGGTVVLVTGPNGDRRAKVLAGHDPARAKPCYVQHLTTCPNSPHYQTRRAATAPKCRAGCGYPMDPWLVEHGYSAHINCLPPLDLPRRRRGLPAREETTR